MTETTRLNEASLEELEYLLDCVGFMELNNHNPLANNIADAIKMAIKDVKFEMERLPFDNPKGRLTEEELTDK
jgi:hypothetical protein